MNHTTSLALSTGLLLCACGGAFSSDGLSHGSGKDGGTGAHPGSGGSSSGGAGSSGGSGTGGSHSDGGSPNAGGAPNTGGSPDTGGTPNAGGSPGTGGMPNTGGSPDTGGVPSSGGVPNTGGVPASGGSAGTGGSAGSCGGILCVSGLDCCGGSCVNFSNDPLHCGSCDKKCDANNPYCSGGQCTQPPCTPLPGAGICAQGSTCCGTTCCAPGEICCEVTSNLTTIGCYDPAKTVGGTCPVGCSLCACASPDTPIATPSGDRSIASLRVGDHVLSVDHGRTVEVPILEVHRTRASNHHVVRVELENGTVLEISAPHPTADGRTFGSLRPHDELGGVPVRNATFIPYEHAFTYDILPASDSGTYFAGGVLIGSTLGGTALSSGPHDAAAISVP